MIELDATSDLIGDEAVKNREILFTAMREGNFLTYPFEWWHFEHVVQEVQKPMDMEITRMHEGLNRG